MVATTDHISIDSFDQ